MITLLNILNVTINLSLLSPDLLLLIWHGWSDHIFDELYLGVVKILSMLSFFYNTEIFLSKTSGLVIQISATLTTPKCLKSWKATLLQANEANPKIPEFKEQLCSTKSYEQQVATLNVHSMVISQNVLAPGCIHPWVGM